jgi:acetyltransferase-like isoleucine patch superfamily enzyme
MAPNAKDNLKGPTIEEGAILGANSTLSPGITIHAHALVGSASNVTKDVDAKSVAYGHPARVQGKRL